MFNEDSIPETQPQFESFSSIPRLTKGMVISEKIDGSNGQIWISEDLSVVKAGSRNQWIAPEKDNYGFAAWVAEHAEELKSLGPGRHFGEWWGAGIQRRYGLKEKRFSLFNVAAWGDDRDRVKYPIDRPACCHVVPVLYRGVFDTAVIDAVLAELALHGSYAVPFMDPEGIVIWHEASRTLYKKTLGGDGHKGAK